MTDIAMEHGHRNSELSPVEMMIFGSYISLPEGIVIQEWGNPINQPVFRGMIEGF